MRQGPHHGAQKSTTTTVWCDWAITLVSKSDSLTSIIAGMADWVISLLSIGSIHAFWGKVFEAIAHAPFGENIDRVGGVNLDFLA